MPEQLDGRNKVSEETCLAKPGPLQPVKERTVLLKALAFCISAAPSGDHLNFKRLYVGFKETDHSPENVKTIQLQRGKKTSCKYKIICKCLKVMNLNKNKTPKPGAGGGRRGWKRS